MEDFYDSPNHLGEGACGTVSRWRLRSSSRKFSSLSQSSSQEEECSTSCPDESYYAVKQIRWKSVWQKKEEQREHEEAVRQELTTLIGLDHPNIALIREWFEDWRDGIFFVMELCEGGSMQDVLETEVCGAKSLEERLEHMPWLQRCFRDLSYAVSYIHSKGVVHRDLKPENVMLKSKDPDSGVKLIDFGLATLVEGEGKGENWQKGTLLFMAPELFLTAGGRFTEKSDMWSMGIILAWTAAALQHGALLHPMLPAEQGEGFDVEQYELFCAYREREPPAEAHFAGMPVAFRSLVLALLQYKPEERASATDCLSNEWVAHRRRSKDSAEILAASGSLEKMKAWSKLTEGDRSMLSLVASNLHDSDISDLVRAFEALDTDRTGHLSKEELVQGFQRCEPNFSRKCVEDIFDNIDTDGSGRIDYHEWLCATISHESLTSPTAMIKAFDCLDASGEGKIHSEQLKSLVGEEGAELIAKRFSRRSSLSLEATDFSEAVRSIISARDGLA